MGIIDTTPYLYVTLKELHPYDGFITSCTCITDFIPIIFYQAIIIFDLLLLSTVQLTNSLQEVLQCTTLLKSYSNISFGINIGLLTYRSVTIILPPSPSKERPTPPIPFLSQALQQVSTFHKHFVKLLSYSLQRLKPYTFTMRIIRGCNISSQYQRADDLQVKLHVSVKQ